MTSFTAPSGVTLHVGHSDDDLCTCGHIRCQHESEELCEGCDCLGFSFDEVASYNAALEREGDR